MLVDGVTYLARPDMVAIGPSRRALGGAYRAPGGNPTVVLEQNIEGTSVPNSGDRGG